MKFSIVILVILALLASCQGSIIIVDDDGPADFSNIQSAIDSASDTDEIILNPGIYTGSGNRDIDFWGKSITISSTDPNDPEVVASTIIDCGGTENDPHRAFIFHYFEDANSVLDGLTITNGYIKQFDGKGGAILCSASSPLIKRCIITDNTVSNGHGGGIYCEYNASPTIENCIIKGNYASANGGGIYLGTDNATVEGCEITDNSAAFDAGGIYISNGASIRKCDINTNKGSGIVCNPGSVVEVNQCTIKGNLLFEGSNGGGIVCRGNAVIRESNITGNTARSEWYRGSSGGGITCSGGVISLSNCVIAGNRSLSGPGRFGELTPGNGGGISCSGGSITASHCTIADNIAQVQGGAIYTEWGDMELSNCIIWGNSPDEISGQQLAITYSDINDSKEGTGNMSVDPLFAASGYWNDGGTAEDVNDDWWSVGDYHLKSEAGRWDSVNQIWVQDSQTSPCIDAGNPGVAVAQETSPNGGRINMGAFGQTSQASLSGEMWFRLGDLNNNQNADYSDLSILTSQWFEQGNHLPGDLDHDGAIRFGDFVVFAECWEQKQ